jgi:creatinine amidohydrolase
LTARAAASTSVVVAPTLTHHYYPAFLEYPGSTSLSLNSARDSTAEIVRSLARFGPRRFYVLNTGMTTQPSLAASAPALAADGILLRHTDWEARLDAASRGLREQDGGGHADEIETSMMLHIDRASVDMTRAVREYAPGSNPFVLTRRRETRGTYSETGVWGDPTRTTAAKGQVLIDALASDIVKEIEALRNSPLPASTGTSDQPRAADRSPVSRGPLETGGCSEGDLRTIRGIGDAFASHWANADADRLGGLWTANGDIVHPDGSIERTPLIIAQNRADLFKRREYRATRHPMQVGVVRCLADGLAVADGKWELRGIVDATGKFLPSLRGLFTMVVERSDATWRIVAYRYTIDPAGPTVPTLLKRPGYPGGFE